MERSRLTRLLSLIPEEGRGMKSITDRAPDGSYLREDDGLGDIDFSISDEGSLVLIRPTNARARAWLEANVQVEPYQRLGRRIACDHRMAPPIIDAIVEEGFNVST